MSEEPRRDERREWLVEVLRVVAAFADHEHEGAGPGALRPVYAACVLLQVPAAVLAAAGLQQWVERVDPNQAVPDADHVRDADLPELRAQWHALATEPLDLLPRKAIEASVRDLARELLARTEPSQPAPDGARR